MHSSRHAAVPALLFLALTAESCQDKPVLDCTTAEQSCFDVAALQVAGPGIISADGTGTYTVTIDVTRQAGATAEIDVGEVELFSDFPLSHGGVFPVLGKSGIRVPAGDSRGTATFTLRCASPTIPGLTLQQTVQGSGVDSGRGGTGYAVPLRARIPQRSGALSDKLDVSCAPRSAIPTIPGPDGPSGPNLPSGPRVP